VSEFSLLLPEPPALQRRGELLCNTIRPNTANDHAENIGARVWAARAEQRHHLQHPQGGTNAKSRKLVGSGQDPMGGNKAYDRQSRVSGTGYNGWSPLSHEGIGLEVHRGAGAEPARAGAQATPAWRRRSPPENIRRAEMSDFHLQNIRNAARYGSAARRMAKGRSAERTWTTGILKRAPPPERREAVLEFLLSREGQRLYVKTRGWSSARADRRAAGYKELPSAVKS